MIIGAIENILNKLFFCYFSIIVSFYRLMIRMADSIFPNLKGRDDRIEQFNSLFMQPDGGNGINTAIGFLFLLILFINWTIGFYTYKIFDPHFDLNWITVVVVLSVSTIAPLYFFVLRKDRYLQYFDKYDQWEKSKRRRNILFSILVYPIVIFLIFYGFKL